MSTASIGKSAIAATFLLLAIAACDSGIRSEPPGAGLSGPRPLEWYEARPDILRARLDPACGRIWALHAGGVDLYDANSDQKLRSIALPEWTWAEAFHSCAPDVAVGPGGDLVVTSNVVPVLWRINAATFEVSRHDLAVDGRQGREIGFSALTWSRQQGAFLGLHADGSFWRIDPLLQRAQQIPLAAPVPKACVLSVKTGVSMQPRQAAFCARTETGEWTIYLAPDFRSGYAHQGQCSIERLAARASTAPQRHF
jgi:hypothetical protein